MVMGRELKMTVDTKEEAQRADSGVLGWVGEGMGWRVSSLSRESPLWR